MTAQRTHNLDSAASQEGFSWRIFGPGILMATAAIGGSHLISSTQAGAIYGWQLAIMIVLANVFKYPFFRFATDYVYDTGESLIAGYAKRSKVYLWIYFILSILSAVISTGAVSLIAAVILGFMLPASLGLSTMALSVIIVAVSWFFLIAGHYKLLDGVTKWIMIALTTATVAAVIIAAGKPTVMAADFVVVSPWNLATLGFIVALMGWMPAPLEFAAITSMWTSAKVKADHTTHRQGLLDFNVGYTVSAILALFFLSLGVFVQYGSGQEIELVGGAYINQLINMYTATIGEWSKLLVAFVAFMCMFGTTITCADGYGRANAECWRLLKGEKEINKKQIAFWTTYAIGGGLVIITFFTGQLGAMLKFAMISAFVSAPIFGWLNYSLVTKHKKLSFGMNVLSIAGLIFLAGFALLFLANLAGLFG
ncbi:MAG: divalent metal cation transporter [Psychrobacter sp.]|uniref:NRAMP family divalent metal transporter n=1 Tax=Psychrobacter namhaensis TaxID=292734 RepID=A0ABW8L6T3_9GAMM|nr:divalent metal cation transporter [Psychrobacter sp. CCUG 69069]MCD1279608.1 divalent metal cation transporter [Psychrobacter sp. CCUG 69069]MCD6251591.1 divalent metal cation transporter [Psychrobacter sp.]